MKLSVSSYNKFVSCPRLYYIEKELGWRDTQKKPWLEFGKSFDDLMAFVDVLGFEEGLKKVDSLFQDPIKAANAEYLLLKWNHQYKNDLQKPKSDMQKPGNQYEININLSHLVQDRFELIFTGFIDKVYENEDGEICINERKTTSDVINKSSAYWNRLNFDPQIVGYAFGLGYELDYQVCHGTYEVFRKPSEAIDKALFGGKSSAEDYRERLLKSFSVRVARDADMVARKSFYITQELKDAWLSEFVQVANEIHEKQVLGQTGDNPESLWVRNKESCELYMGCAYKAFCGCRSDLENITGIYQVKK